MSEAGANVLESFMDAVTREPAALAVRDPRTTLSRTVLEARSRAVASTLRAQGIGSGDLVGVCIERSAELVVALLGVLRAGAAYVAIDPSYPQERIDWMLADSAAKRVLTAADIRFDAEVPAGDDVFALPADDDLAYVVYTSGSTGRPKGVAIDHRALATLIAWHLEAFGLGDADRCTQLASPGFDAAVWEIWPAVAAGAELCVVPEALKTDPLGLRDWIVDEQVDVGFFPTAVAEGLIGLDWPEATRLRVMLTGGDALTRRPAAGLPFTLVNNYGVSEATVVATSGAVASSGTMPPSIGRPITGVLVELHDEDGRPVRTGDEGELVIGGPAVGCGYLNRPELTAERFWEDARGRWYRTGDRMRFTAAGELEFLGRVDDQLSIRGFRVEPGDVVSALIAHPGVAAAAALGEGGSSADRRLVAHVVASGPPPEDADLTRFLASRLPDHMWPSTYVWHAALPTTAHGKVDRAALAAARSEPADPFESTDAEASVAGTIAGIIAELLGVQSVGESENFFLRGGHSMLGAQLIVRLDELYDVEVSLRYLFDHPTATDLAAEVDRQRLEFAEDLADDDLAGDPALTR